MVAASALIISSANVIGNARSTVFNVPLAVLSYPTLSRAVNIEAVGEPAIDRGWLDMCQLAVMPGSQFPRSGERVLRQAQRVVVADPQFVGVWHEPLRGSSDFGAVDGIAGDDGPAVAAPFDGDAPTQRTRAGLAAQTPGQERDGASGLILNDVAIVSDVPDDGELHAIREVGGQRRRVDGFISIHLPTLLDLSDATDQRPESYLESCNTGSGRVRQNPGQSEAQTPFSAEHRAYRAPPELLVSGVRDGPGCPGHTWWSSSSSSVPAGETVASSVNTTGDWRRVLTRSSKTSGLL